MKALIPTSLIAALAVFAVAQNPATEEAPPGSLEKIAAALPEKAYAKPAKSRKLLIFSKTAGFRHASIATGKLALTEMGKKTGAFETIISDDLSNFEAATIESFDGILFLSTTNNPFAPHPTEAAKLSEDGKKAASVRELALKANLMSFVKNGGAFIGIHAATDTCYEWEEFGRMINGYFDGHPWQAGTEVSIKTEPGQEKHPLVAMFDGQNVDFKDEIYQLKAPYDSKAVHMLLRLDVEKTDMKVGGIHRTDNDFGISWVRRWEKGRVFYCSLGHNHEMFWHPKVVRHYLAGIQWALGDYNAPISSK